MSNFFENPLAGNCEIFDSNNFDNKEAFGEFSIVLDDQFQGIRVLKRCRYYVSNRVCMADDKWRGQLVHNGFSIEILFLSFLSLVRKTGRPYGIHALGLTDIKLYKHIKSLYEFMRKHRRRIIKLLSGAVEISSEFIAVLTYGTTPENRWYETRDLIDVSQQFEAENDIDPHYPEHGEVMYTYAIGKLQPIVHMWNHLNIDKSTPFVFVAPPVYLLLEVIFDLIMLSGFPLPINMSAVYVMPALLEQNEVDGHNEHKNWRFWRRAKDNIVLHQDKETIVKVEELYLMEYKFALAEYYIANVRGIVGSFSCAWEDQVDEMLIHDTILKTFYVEESGQDDDPAKKEPEENCILKKRPVASSDASFSAYAVLASRPEAVLPPSYVANFFLFTDTGYTQALHIFRLITEHVWLDEIKSANE